MGLLKSERHGISRLRVTSSALQQYKQTNDRESWTTHRVVLVLQLALVPGAGVVAAEAVGNAPPTSLLLLLIRMLALTAVMRIGCCCCCCC